MAVKRRFEPSSRPRARTLRWLLRTALAVGCAALGGTFAGSAAAQSLNLGLDWVWEDPEPPSTLDAITPDGDWLTLEPGVGTQYLPEDTLLITPWGTTDEGRFQRFSPEGELLFDIQIGGALPEPTVDGSWDPNFGDSSIDSDWYGPLAQADGSDFDDFGWYGPLPDFDPSEHWSPYGGSSGFGLAPEYAGPYADAESASFPSLDGVFSGVPTDVPGVSVSSYWSLDDLLSFGSPQ